MTNPQKKSDGVLRQLHFNSKFESLLALRVKLIEEFQDQVPNIVVFNVGYFEGQQYSKISLVTTEDLTAMYVRYLKGEVTLWCDGCTQATGQELLSDGKCKREEVASKCQEKKDEVDTIFKELEQKHGDTYDVPKLRLWARMITSDLHDDYENLPNIPAFQGSVSKKYHQQSNFSDALSGAVVVFANALKIGNASTSVSTDKVPTSSTSSMSPTKAIELRMKISYLKQLFDDNILSEDEYTDQKQNILSTLKALH